MTAAFRRLEAVWMRYWFRPEPFVNLAVLRIVAVAFKFFAWPELGYLRQKASLPPELYQPPHLLWLLMAPFGGGPPAIEWVEAIWWISLVAGPFALIGLLTRTSLLVFASSLVFLSCYAYAWSEFHHTEEILHLTLLLLAFAPSGRALSIDALVWPGEGALDRSPFVRWPRLAAAWVISLVYLSAGTSKLLYGEGAAWLNGYTLQFYLVQDGLRYDRPLGLLLAEQHGLALLASWATVAFECLFWVVLVVPALWLLIVPAGVVFHTTIFLIQGPPFFSFFPLYVALIPVGSLVERARAWRRDTSS